METKPTWISSTSATAMWANTWTTTVTASRATTHAAVVSQLETKTVTVVKQMPNSMVGDAFATTGISWTTMETACFVIPHALPVPTVPLLDVSVASTELPYKPMEHATVQQVHTLIPTGSARAVS